MNYPTISSNGVGIIPAYAETDVNTVDKLRQNGCTVGRCFHIDDHSTIYGNEIVGPVEHPLYFVYLSMSGYACVYLFAKAITYIAFDELGPFFSSNSFNGYHKIADGNASIVYEKIPGIATVSTEAEGRALIEQLKTVDIPAQFEYQGGYCQTTSQLPLCGVNREPSPRKGGGLR